MARTRSMLKEVIGHRRTVEIEAGRSSSVEDAVASAESQSTCRIRWKKEYEGPLVD